MAIAAAVRDLAAGQPPWAVAMSTAVLMALAGLLTMAGTILDWRRRSHEAVRAGPGRAGTGRGPAVWLHLSPLLLYVGVPMGQLLGPMLAERRMAGAGLHEQVTALLDFQLGMTLAGSVTLLLALFGIGWLLLPVVAAFHLLVTVLAALAAARGRPFRYPLRPGLIGRRPVAAANPD
jgi:uncharacterized Tic20 family protein